MNTENKKSPKTVECKSKSGIIVGLIDSIITTAVVLKKLMGKDDLHDSIHPEINEAIKDLKSDDDVSYLLTGKSAKEWEENRRVISMVVKKIK